MVYEVIVVGAGPAGSTAARYCAKSGLRTLLLEKEELPRHKPCGGALSNKTLSLLDFKLKPDLAEGEFFGMRTTYRGRSTEARMPKRVGVVTSRDAFDFFLSEKAVDAGAELRDSERVSSVATCGDCMEVKTTGGTYRADAVVGADGVNSVVASSVRPAFRRDELALALETEVPAESIDVDSQGLLSFYFDVPGGYGWVFPKGDRLSVGVGGMLGVLKEPPEVFRGFLHGLGFKENVKPSAHLIPLGGVRRKTVSDRIILAGDAAGWVDPLHFEGIYPAVFSGKIAAESILDAHGSEDFSAGMLGSYASRCHGCFGRGLGYSLLLSRFSYRLPFLKNVTVGNREVILKLLELGGGKEDYPGFFRWFVPRLPYFLLRSLAR